jgi:nucleoid-associated protein YgaU
MSFSVRFALLPGLFLAALSALAAETAPSTSAQRSVIADLESKLSAALRSYTLIDAELDRLKAANAQLTSEKAALEAKLAETQAAMPLAAQAVTLREQLRQTQAQMAAYAEENVQLKTKLALHSPDSARSNPPPSATVAATPASVPSPGTPAADTPRTHVIVEGDTLVKISQTYYGTANRWNEILAANRDVLRDEKSLVIGRSLIIP